MRVVLPYDGSVSADHAVEYVVALAGQLRRDALEVHVVNAQEVGAGVAGIFGGDAADVAAKLAETAVQTGQRTLVRAVEPLRAAGLVVREGVLIGEPPSVIADYVERNICEAVVMGTRGLGRVGGLVLGSVASKLIHLLKVPVTLVK